MNILYNNPVQVEKFFDTLCLLFIHPGAPNLISLRCLFALSSPPSRLVANWLLTMSLFGSSSPSSAVR